MSSINVTEFYGLTQYAGTDKPSFTDNNEAFRAVDAALHGAVADVADASDNITTLTGRVGDVEEAVTGLSGTVGTQGDAITVLQNKEISQDGDIAEAKAAALDMVCAYNEEAAQSVHAYAIGDFFRYNDVLYKATAVINIGDTIIPNTNCVATNVTEQLLNDVDKVGDLSSLTTTDKSSAVAAINEVNASLTQWHTSDNLLIQYSEKSTKSIDLTLINAKEFTVLFNGAITPARVVIKIPNIFISDTTYFYYGGGTNGTDDLYAVCKVTNGILTFTDFSKQGVSDTSSSLRVLY